MKWHKFPEKLPPKDLVVITVLYGPDEDKCVACLLAYCPCGSCGWHTNDAVFKDAPVVEWSRLENIKKDSLDLFAKTLATETYTADVLDKEEIIEIIKKKTEDICLSFATEEAIG